MAGVVNNLRVNGKEVKKTYFNNKIIKEIYLNDVLIWKNANPVIFARNLNNIDLSAYGSDTMIFVGFGNEFVGSYNLVEDAQKEVENGGLTQGQMVVETTDGEK